MTALEQILKYAEESNYFNGSKTIEEARQELRKLIVIDDYHNCELSDEDREKLRKWFKSLAKDYTITTLIVKEDSK